MARGKNKIEEKKQVSKGLTVNQEEERMARIIEQLSGFEEWQRDVPAVLKKAILDGKEAPELYKEFANVAAVRVIQVLMTEGDSGKALSAAKELLDRHYGKATERRIVKHELEDIPDDQLDAIILSEFDDLEEVSDD